MKKGKGKSNGLLPNSLRIISSCLKTVSSNATTVASTVRSAGASVAASISSSFDDHKDQVIWAGFDKLEISRSSFKHVLLLGYQNGFQVLDVEDASNFSEVVSKRDGPVTFLQMQPLPDKSTGLEGFRSAHPLLLVVDNPCLSQEQSCNSSGHSVKNGNSESQTGNCVNSVSVVRFYSLRSHSYVHHLPFRSAVFMVRCSPKIIAVGLTSQICCFDATTLEKKFSVLTHPVPQLAGQGPFRVNVGYGPMALGPRWLAYAPNSTLTSNSGRLSPRNLTPSACGSQSASPGSGNLVARYAVESGKQLAAGIINLGDMGYKAVSKYYQELVPDGSSSPVSSSSGRKVSRPAVVEADSAGMVVVKDFVSRAVISQFKAHNSPVSALCFDPSGTLLVTVSEDGIDINVFRIMPSRIHSGSGAQNYDWSSSHVHLYKLHRGISSANIQDICFSHSSQWVAIVSSKGTCHVFTVSPFGGDPGFQTQNSLGEELSLCPVLSIPWWSTSSSMTNKQPFTPPPPVTLSVVSRIKYNDSGWLHTVSTAAATGTGKVFVPSGAVAAIFHNALSQSPHSVNLRGNILEHILVYTPSGHVIQHKLLSSVGTEPTESGSKVRPGSFLQIQKDEFEVKVGPAQWWDVCRRPDWPEREECVFGLGLSKSDREENNGRELLHENSREEDKLLKTDFLKPRHRSNLYLSNAEVQISSGRFPLWHKPKISFYVMSCPKFKDFSNSEFEIEKVPVFEVEVKRKELLPVFDHFHSIKPSWSDRTHASERYPAISPAEPHQAKEKVTEESFICYSKPASLCSTESSDAGSSRRIENLSDMEQTNIDKPYMFCSQISNELTLERKGRTIFDSSLLDQKSSAIMSLSSDLSKDIDLSGGKCNMDGPSLLQGNSHPSRSPYSEATSLTDNSDVNEVSFLGTVSPDENDNCMERTVLLTDHDALAKEHDLLADYCRTLHDDGCQQVSEVVTDIPDSSSSQCEGENTVEDGENDEMFGRIFDFSEG